MNQTSEAVERFDLYFSTHWESAYIGPMAGGAYVHYDDYEDLAAQNAELQAKLNSLSATTQTRTEAQLRDEALEEAAQWHEGKAEEASDHPVTGTPRARYHNDSAAALRRPKGGV